MERDYKELKGCEICQKTFSISRIRHKCKRCKLIICADCGKAKSIIIGYKVSPKTPHRICNLCRDDVTSQQEMKTKYNTSWATLSQLGKQWLSACNPLEELALKFDYSRYVEESHSNNDLASLITELTDDLAQGRADREFYNYSLTEFLFYSQHGTEREQVRRNVENVLRAYYARNPDQGYCSLLVNIATFLLCFTDEESAFLLLCYLNERIVPDRFWDSFSAPVPYIGLLKEKYIIKHAVRKAFTNNGDNNTLKPFEIVYKKVSNVMMGALLVDVVNFNTQIYVWNNMFLHKSFRPFETAAVKILLASKHYFDKFFHLSLYNFRIFVCRNIHAIGLQNDSTQLTDEEKNSSAEVFDNTIVEKYVNANRVLNSTLERLKSLNHDEADVILSRLRLLIQSQRAEKRDDSSYVELDNAAFLNVFRDINSLSDLEEKDITEIFETLDLHKRGLVSSRVLAGLIILLISENLDAKLNDIFNLFAVENQKTISKKEIPKIIDFLSDILPVMNEANPTYLNFQVHLYEMLETLRKKGKKMQQLSAQDFMSIVGKYPVFQVVTGQKQGFKRAESFMADFTQDETILEDNSSPTTQSQSTDNSLFPQQLIIEVDAKDNDKDSDEGLREEEVKEVEAIENAEGHRVDEVMGDRGSEFLNANAIKDHIVPGARKTEKAVNEKDNSCQLCNMF